SAGSSGRAGSAGAGGGKAQGGTDGSGGFSGGTGTGGFGGGFGGSGTFGGAAGKGGAAGSVICSDQQCQSVPTPVGVTIPACCSENGKCGLDTTLLAQAGLKFDPVCQE